MESNNVTPPLMRGSLIPDSLGRPRILTSVEVKMVGGGLIIVDYDWDALQTKSLPIPIPVPGELNAFCGVNFYCPGPPPTPTPPPKPK